MELPNYVFQSPSLLMSELALEQELGKCTSMEKRIFDVINGQVHVDEILAQCNGEYSSSNPLKVTILASKWEQNIELLMVRELAKQLAKFRQLKVTVLVPENSEISEEDKKEAQSLYMFTIVEAKEQPGFVQPIEWLNFPPADLSTDIVVGYGEKLGKIALYWKERIQCKSIHIFGDCLFNHYLVLEIILIEIESLLKKIISKTTNGICEVADICVATGPKMSERLSASLRYKNKNVFNLTPGIISEFRDLPHAANDGGKFRVLLVGGDKPDNFQKEGLAIAAKAVTELKDKSYHLIYVGAGEGNMEQFAHEFHVKCGVSKAQFEIRSLPKDDEEWKRLFCEVDLAIMPSGEKEFGWEALVALSAGLPVLVHGDSGFGEALKAVKYGTSAIVDSEDAAEWASEISKVRKTDRKQRLEQAAELRSQYDKMYNWDEQCGHLVEKMLEKCSGQQVLQVSYV